MLHLALTSALALAPIASAPTDLPSLESCRFPPPDRVLFDDVGDGARWALGRTYKASVDASGFLFAPFVGAEADPVRARLEVRAVTVGGAVLDLGPPAVGREGDDLVIDRGALVERYACGLESVEQFLEVDLEGISGNLRIDVRVDTTLASPREEAAPFTYGGGAVRIGEAYVVAEGGARDPVAARRTADGYAIEVPASRVAAAGDSILIDPVLSAGFLTGNSLREDLAADVASIGSLGFFVVVERAFSATDSDVFIYRVPVSLSAPASFIATIDFTTTNWEEPAIAGTENFDQLMVVATRGLDAARRIVSRSARADGSATGTPQLVSPFSAEAFAPDIGAESTGPFLLPRYCVVWNDLPLIVNQEPDALLAVLDNNGTSIAWRTLEVGFDSSGPPAVSNGSGEPSFGASAAFRVALTRTDVAGSQAVWSSTFDRDGVTVTPRWRVSGCENAQRVSIASSNASRLPDGAAPYVVAWDSGPLGGGDIYTAVCAEGEVRGGVSRISEMSDGPANQDRRRPAVAATRDQWVLAWQQRPVPVGRWTVRMVSGDATGIGFGLGEREQGLLFGTSDRESASVVTRYEGGESESAGDEGFVVWTNTTGSTATEGGYVEPIGGDVAGLQYCSANASSSGRRAWAAAFGDGSVGTPHELRCVDAPVGVPCFFLVSRQSAFVPNPGGSAGNLCLSGVGFGRYSNAIGPTDPDGTYSLTIDPAAIPQSGGTVAASVGEIWHFQAWFRDSSGGVPTSNLSNGVAIRFTH